MFKSKIVFALAMGFTFLMMSACDDSSSSPTDDSENNLSSVSTPATSSSSGNSEIENPTSSNSDDDDFEIFTSCDFKKSDDTWILENETIQMIIKWDGDNAQVTTLIKQETNSEAECELLIKLMGDKMQHTIDSLMSEDTPEEDQIEFEPSKQYCKGSTDYVEIESKTKENANRDETYEEAKQSCQTN